MANTRSDKAYSRLNELREMGFSDTEILEYVVCNYLSGDDALEAIQSFADERDIEWEES